MFEIATGIASEAIYRERGELTDYGSYVHPQVRDRSKWSI
jgi:hypothetical protein